MLLDDKGLSGKQLLGGAAVAGVAGYGALKLAGLGLSRLGSKAAGGLVLHRGPAGRACRAQAAAARLCGQQTDEPYP